MNEEKETPEKRRERLRQGELKRNPSSSINGGGLVDLVGSLSWKGIGIILILLLAGLVVGLFLL